MQKYRFIKFATARLLLSSMGCSEWKMMYLVSISNRLKILNFDITGLYDVSLKLDMSSSPSFTSDHADSAFIKATFFLSGQQQRCVVPPMLCAHLLIMPRSGRTRTEAMYWLGFVFVPLHMSTHVYLCFLAAIP